MATEVVRESLLAGSWYPSDPGKLRKQISAYVSRANPPHIEGTLMGLVCPHAGYMYSGGVAAYAYKLLSRSPFERVLILAPSHHAHFQGASVYSEGGYRTPLGVVPIDAEMIETLRKKSSLFGYFPRADLEEHSLEIQLPFLQTVLPRFSLVPIIMGNQDYEHCESLAQALAEVCAEKRTLLVASTDLSHYYTYEDAISFDRVFLDHMKDFDIEGLSRDILSQKCYACGAGPVLTLMLAAKKLGADCSKVLHYANSGDVTGEKTGGVVGYMAAALFRSPENTETLKDRDAESGIDLGFTDEERKFLKDLAYQAIRSRCLGQPMPEISREFPRLRENRGAFVCIHKGKDLRGCIGVIEGREPLFDTIKRMAVEAAFGDPRFCSLAREELDEIDVEVSVLTPLERIHDASEVEIGKHGIFIRKGLRSGLLLPQVAVEQGWNREQFLEWTCRKAGLPQNAWKDPDCTIYVFSADVF